MDIEFVPKDRFVEFADECLQKFATDIPVTYSRAVSQALNPDAKEDDILMVLAKEENRLLSFIGVYPGLVQGDPKKRIYWVSCWWKAKDVSSKLSHTLLQRFLEWAKGEVGLPHLPPHIIKVLEKNNIGIHERDGIMIRFRLALHERSLQRSFTGNYKEVIRMLRRSAILKLTDSFVNLFKTSKIIDAKTGYSKYFHAGKEIPDNDYFKFIKKNFTEYLTLPDRNNIQWIISNPWLVHSKFANPEVAARYHFSYISDDFHYFFPILKKNNEIVAAGFFSSREGAVKSLFVFVLPEYREEYFRNLCLHIQSHKEYHTLITYDQRFLDFLLKYNRRSAIKIKRYTGIGNPDYRGLIPTDGDGDSCFT